MATSLPPTRTPTKSPRRWVFSKNGPGSVRVASAKHVGGVHVAQRGDREVGSGAGAQLVRDHLHAQVLGDGGEARGRGGGIGFEQGYVTVLGHERRECGEAELRAILDAGEDAVGGVIAASGAPDDRKAGVAAAECRAGRLVEEVCGRHATFYRQEQRRVDSAALWHASEWSAVRGKWP
jgi:hypothetical protein